ncbi:EAP30/Vps36 family-domain-containing protein [Tricharina praecox]|uniref:EAP30/Vps36 family-domain-containing protein n=1 Tax=Tricharina praecox TaxID=43433 RepID=UPI00221ED514|nr:EAP30/Vps36 family-domain-containing protein [Tricharina praecox]KAI5842855.1 EAP30/Vps36 family-domain-containing protein [Tricharina praecox]
MQKGVGLGALSRNSKHSQLYASHGERLQRSHADKLSTQLSVFQAALIEFSRTHAKDIRSNPLFRAEFARMCTAIGVDPLASSSNKKGGSFWAETLGTSVNDFYFELAVRVVEVCRRSRDENGGLIAVAEVRDRIEKLDERIGGGASGVSEDDILRAVESLKPLGSGFTVIELGRRQMIRSVPKELNTDQSTVMEAIQVLGFVTHSMLRDNLSWDRARVQTVIDDLLSDSLVWVDSQAEEKEYWAPTFIGNIGK